MLKTNIHHESTKNTLSDNTTHSKKPKDEFIDYIALDKFRREIMHQEEETLRTWKEKYDPWLIDEYRAMYQSVSKRRGIPPDNRIISLKRPEWKQPEDTLPPLSTRLPGQRRRRLPGAFPQTENDKIGWRILPEHSLDKYGSNIAHIPPLPKQYKFSSWPMDSFY